MKALARWVADSIAFYLALYLVDSLVSPSFHVGAVWLAVVLALFLGLVNSPIRPLRQITRRPWRAAAESVTTVLLNTLFLYIPIWAGGPLSATNPLWVLLTAVFITVLGGTINWLIGFKKEEKPRQAARTITRARAQATNSDAKRTARASRPRP